MKLRRIHPMRGGSRRLRLVQWLAAGTLAVGVVGMLTTGAGGQERDSGSAGNSGAENTNTFQLSAQSNALDVLLIDPSAPLASGFSAEVGPWGASALVNSLGESMSDAGAPYSPSVASLPGTVNGIGAGKLPPLPPVPGYVSAEYPQRQNNTQTQGGYQISSTASSTSAKGAVSLGVQPSGSPNPTFFASAQTTGNSDGSVTASASAGIDALDFGQLLDLGNVSSSLSLTQQSSQQPKITSQTNLGTVTLVGQQSGLGAGTLNVLGVGTPLDLNGEVIGALNQVLGPAGITITYLPETFTYTDGSTSTGSTPQSSKTLQAVDSAGLQILVSENSSSGPIGMKYTLGRVYASTTDTPGFGTTGNSGVTVGNTGTSSPGAAPTALGNTGAIATASAVPTGSTGPVTQSTTAPPPSQSPHAIAEAPAYALEEGPPTQSVYLVLVLAALAVLLVSQAVRYLAVRLALSGRTA